MLTKREEAKIERRSIMNGKGEVTFEHLFNREQMLEKARLCAVITIPAGGSIGEHAHEKDAEIYYLLEGELLADDNGTEVVMRPGDAMFTGGGDRHSAVNRTDKDAKMLAIVIL